MDKMNMKELIIGDLTAKIPIIQGGMGVGISLSSLASAVANQGGIGVIAAAGIGMLEPDNSTNFVEATQHLCRSGFSSFILGAGTPIHDKYCQRSGVQPPCRPAA